MLGLLVVVIHDFCSMMSWYFFYDELDTLGTYIWPQH